MLCPNGFRGDQPAFVSRRVRIEGGEGKGYAQAAGENPLMIRGRDKEGQQGRRAAGQQGSRAAGRLGHGSKIRKPTDDGDT